MASNSIVLKDTTYNGVSSIEVPMSGGGSALFTDVSDTTAAAADVAQGKYFYTAAGAKTQGTAAGGGDDGSLKSLIDRTVSSFDFPSGLTAIGASAFQFCTYLEISSIPSGVTSINDNAFQRCRNITSLALPSSLRTIGIDVFKYCSGLTSVTCAGNVTIGSGAFHNCTNLASASFPSMNVGNFSTVFGSSTSSNACQNLAFVDIGMSGKIAANAFANCYKLQTLVLRKTSAVCTLANVSAFTNTPMRGYGSLTGTVYVPSALISSYQAETNWSTLYSGGTLTFAAIEGSPYEL